MRLGKITRLRTCIICNNPLGKGTDHAKCAKEMERNSASARRGRKATRKNYIAGRLPDFMNS